jgi:regulator of replication initiation timing
MGRKNQVGLVLSPKAVELLDELAQQTDASRAEVFEAIAQAQLALHADAPKWSFHLVPTADKTEVKPWQDAAKDTPNAPAEAIPADHSDASPQEPPPTTRQVSEAETELTQLRQEKAALQAQLNEARSQLQHLQTQAAQPQPTTPPPVPQSSTSQPVAPATAATTDVAEQLRNQLINLKQAYAELAAVHQEQQSENQRLQAALAQSRSLANIGEAQLKRWQYKSFSR